MSLAAQIIANRKHCDVASGFSPKHCAWSWQTNSERTSLLVAAQKVDWNRYHRTNKSKAFCLYLGPCHEFVSRLSRELASWSNKLADSARTIVNNCACDELATRQNVNRAVSETFLHSFAVLFRLSFCDTFKACSFSIAASMWLGYILANVHFHRWAFAKTILSEIFRKCGFSFRKGMLL